MRAQFYSMIAVLITLPILAFLTSYASFYQSLGYGVSDRVVSDQLHQMSDSIEMDTIKAMEITGRRALLAATNFVINSGRPLGDARANITTLMLTGNINGTFNFMMTNNTMPNWSQRISSKPVNFDIVLEYGNISIDNLGGFSLIIGMDYNLTVTDRIKTVRIDRLNMRKYVTISVIGIEDPVFPLSTQGFIRRLIRPAWPAHFAIRILAASGNYSGACSGLATFNKSECDASKILVADDSDGVVFSCFRGIVLGDDDNLTGNIGCYISGNSSAVGLVNGTINSTGYGIIHIDNETVSVWSLPGPVNLSERLYYAGNGPDFLKRLEGNLTPSPNGLVTFAYIPELEEQAIPIGPFSRVEYLYFSDQGSCTRLRYSPAWFGFGSASADMLNVSALLTGTICESGTP